MGDFYDFTSSYPADEDEEWEDAGDEEDENMEVDGDSEVLDLTTTKKPSILRVMRRSRMTRSGTATPNSSWFSLWCASRPPFSPSLLRPVVA